MRVPLETGLDESHQPVRVLHLAHLPLALPKRWLSLGRRDCLRHFLLSHIYAFEPGCPANGAHDVEPMEPLLHRGRKWDAAHGLCVGANGRDKPSQGWGCLIDPEIEMDIPSRHNAPKWTTS